MEVLHARCAGIDVHKKNVVVCCRLITSAAQVTTDIRTFGTMTTDLLNLATWLTSLAITHIARESTGEFWQPVYNLLEASCTVLVVNAHHSKHVPGRKTDVRDADWLADLLAHGLVRGSFVPSRPQRELRDLTRQRTNVVRDRANVVNRPGTLWVQVLEWANIKLAAVATDILGTSARAMLEALVAGEEDAAVLAELAKGRLRTKRAALAQALRGQVSDHHRFLIAQHLAHVDFLDEQIATFDHQIEAAIQAQTPPAGPSDDERPRGGDGAARGAAPRQAAVPGTAVTWDEASTILDSIPGIGRQVAEQLVAALGVNMDQFPTAGHAAKWARLAPGHHARAGKRASARVGKGNRWLRSALIQAAHAAVKVKASYLRAFYQRLVVRRGVKKAIVAVAHKLLTSAYTLLRTREPYREPGGTYVDERRKAQVLHRMQRRIEQLGYTVHLEPVMAAAA